MTEAEMRQVISQALDEFLYRLDIRYPTRQEFNQLRDETDSHESAMAVLRVEFEALRKEVARLGVTIERAATWVTVSLASAVLAATLNLVLK